MRFRIDNRVRVSGATPAEEAALKALCEHENPRRIDLPRLEAMLEQRRFDGRLRAQVMSARQEPAILRTWRVEDGELTLPRGVWNKSPLGGLSTFEDYRASGAAFDPVEWRLKKAPRDYQEAALERMDRDEQGLLRQSAGCIAGSALISISRAGKGFRKPLSYVVDMFNGGSVGRGKGKRLKTRWDPSIPTFVRAPFPDGSVRLARIIGAKASGRRAVFRVTLEEAADRGTKAGWRSDCVERCFFKFVEATEEHRFLTPFGWVELRDLVAGDYAMVDGGIPNGRSPKKDYPSRVTPNHPHCTHRGRGRMTVPTHRLVAEAQLNGMGLEAFLAAVAERRPGLEFLDPKTKVVHHKDENPRNYDLQNLEVLTPDEHRQEHRDGSVRNLTSRLLPARIRSIVFVGEEETFDLEVEGASAFLANGIAVHNSGKTLTLLTFAARRGLPTIVIVPSQALLEQWVAVAIQDFGLSPDEIGCVGGGTKKIRPLTIALVDSLAASDCKLAKELSRTFGILLFDEVYGAPARTRYDVVDCFAARYRFGAGDDERRKDDVECLTYDLFGEVLAEAPRAMLEKLGWIHSVRVRLVETGTPAPKWWLDLPPLARATRYLEILRYLEDDPKRAALVAALTCMAVRSGNQVLVFGHHRDHALRMQANVAAMAPDLAVATGRFLGGTAASKERQETTVGLLEGSCKAAFATYKALGKGINLPAVSRAVLATPIHGARENVNQVLARINRTADGKDRPEAVVLYDSEVFGLAPVRAYMKGKRDVVVQTTDGRELPARDYIEEHEAKSNADKVTPADFFAGLG